MIVFLEIHYFYKLVTHWMTDEIVLFKLKSMLRGNLKIYVFFYLFLYFNLNGMTNSYNFLWILIYILWCWLFILFPSKTKMYYLGQGILRTLFNYGL